MRRSSLWSDQEGSAALEFLTVGVILLIPLAYLVIALAEIQQASLGVEATARYAARSIAHGADAGPDAVISSVADAYGLDESALDAQVACTPRAASCPSAGSTVLVTVTQRVSLPLVPPVLGLDDALAVPVDATAAYRVGRLWSAAP